MLPFLSVTQVEQKAQSRLAKELAQACDMRPILRRERRGFGATCGGVVTGLGVQVWVARQTS